MRIVPHFVLVLSQPKYQFEINDDVVLVPDVRHVQPRVIGGHTVQEAGVVDFDGVRLWRVGDGGRCFVN